MAPVMMKGFVMGSVRSVVFDIMKKSSVRSISSTGSRFSLKTKEKGIPSEEHITKSVFMSQSTDIFTNLALEDWIYQNMDFTNHHIMMVWRNDPCVVIGRHQNPWLEANVPLLAEKDIALARRNSGGGTVYHDRGNLNVTFFTPRDRYDRKYNLELIKRALFRGFGVKCEINERQDIVIQDKYKISGTAAKLGRLSGYHHCTLLVNANKTDLRKALSKREHGIQTNATPSTPSPVANLNELSNKVTVDSLQTALGYEYLRTHALKLIDGGQDFISRQRGFQFINPTDDWFPGLEKLKSELVSWDWRFGRTPVFTVSRTFPVPPELLAPSKVYSATQELSINMTVEKGLISEVTLNIPKGFVESGFHGEASVVTQLKGKRFTSEALSALQEAMLTHHAGDVKQLDEKEQFVAKCFNQVVNTI